MGEELLSESARNSKDRSAATQRLIQAVSVTDAEDYF